MRRTLLVLVVAAAVTLAVGLLTGSGWPGYVVGAVLALALWVMLFAGSFAGRACRGEVGADAYAVAAVTGVALGYLLFRVGDENAVFWASGFIVAGAISPAVRAAARDRG